MAADCSNKDSEFYNDVFVMVPNLVTVEMNSNVVYVNASFSRFLNVSNQAHPLDIYKTTGGAAKLGFSYEIEKEDNGTWSFIDFTNDQFQIEKGNAEAESVEVGSFVYGTSIYNATNQFYEYRVGIKSLPPGNYRLSFGYNSNSATDVEFRSESSDNNLFLNLNSACSSLDGSGNFNFTIN
jgi:hypothetical protein